MTGIASITSKNQLTLPVELIRRTGWLAGTKLLVKVTGDQVVLKKVPSLGELREKLTHYSLTQKFTVSQAIKLAQKNAAEKIVAEMDEK